MATPSYKPINNTPTVTPGPEAPLTYEQFLAQRGQGQGNFQAPQQQQDPFQSIDPQAIAREYAQNQAENYIKDTLFSSGAEAGVVDAAGASTTFSG